MTISPESEQVIREAEYNVNKVWSTWRREFDSKTSKEVLAMVAFQFAKLYYLQNSIVADEHKILSDFESELDRLLKLTDDRAVYASQSPVTDMSDK